MSNVYLETERFYLRDYVINDIDNLVHLDSYPEVTLYINGGDPVPRSWWEDTGIPTIFGYYNRYERKLGNWILIDKKNEEFLGWFHLRPSKDDLENTKRLELGYRLLPSVWGKGCASEVSKSLIDKAFNELGADEVFASAMKTNKASIKVMENCGMSFQGEYEEIRYPKEPKTAVKYSIFNV